MAESLSPWPNLSLYESTDLLKKFHKEKFGREINSGKAFEISSHVAQGREYFESAASSSVLVKPLLIYYGVLVLTRGLILYSNGSLRESGLSQSHGLSAVSWGRTLAGGVGDLSEIVIRADGGGTLGQLISIQKSHDLWINNLNPLYRFMPISLGNIRWSTDFTVTLGEILSRTPELISPYLKVMGTTPKCRIVRVALDVSDITDLSSAGRKAALATADMSHNGDDFQEIRRYFRLPMEKSTSRDHVFCGENIRVVSVITNFEISSTSEMNDILLSCEDLHDTFKEDSQGYLVFNFESGAKLSKLTRMYCLSYALGMLVRYNPTVWSSIVNKRGGDKYFPLLKSATDVLQELYPKLILWHLQGHRLMS